MEPILTRLRSAEIERVRSVLAEHRNILEIGGGNGWQAHVLSEWGHKVSSVDIEPSSIYFPVMQYDGTHLPFASGHFDAIFSSHVLEHVENVRELLRESQRVMARGGIAVHIVPTPFWRAWTLLAHYPHIVRRLSHKAPPASSAGDSAPRARSRLRSLISATHGVSRSPFHELYDFSSQRWRKDFAACGFRLIAEFPAGVFYTGYALLPGLPIAARQRLARIAGSSGRVYVSTKA